MNDRTLICVSYPAGSSGSFILSLLVSGILQDKKLFIFDNVANCHPYKINYLRTYIPEEFDVLKANYETLLRVPINPVVIYCQNIMPRNQSQNHFKQTKIVAIDYDTEDDLLWMLTNHFYKAEIDFDVTKQQTLDMWKVYKLLAFAGKVSTKNIDNLNQLPNDEVETVLREYTRRYFRNFRNFGPGWKFNWNVLNGHDPKNIILLRFRDIMTDPKCVLDRISELIGPSEPTNIINYINYLEAQLVFIATKANWLSANIAHIRKGLAELYKLNGTREYEQA